MRLWKRGYTVSIEAPDRSRCLPIRVRAWCEEDALVRATYYWFKHCKGDAPWYEWHYEVVT